MDKNLNINDLTSSNFLTAGGLLQTASDQFILLLGARTPVFNARADDSHQLFVYSPQFWDFLLEDSESHKGLFSVEKTLQLTREELKNYLEKFVLAKATKLSLIDNHQSDFEAQFAWSQKNFREKLLQKTVPATKFEFSIKEKFNFAYQLYLSLQKNRPGFIYGLWDEGGGFLGLTPELLAAWDGKKLSTMALAGTWSNDQSFEHVSDVDMKTREEHEFVVNDIRERLGKISVGKTEILTLPTLSHLKTEIAQECLQQQDFILAVEKLHPTAALGIYPRKPELAQEFSKFNVQRQRGFFGAPFGVIGQNFAHVVVAIRGLIWTTNRVNLFVGCGVTAQSDETNEWQELQTKKKAICEAFSLQIL
ncbi:MAG: chorismate-binding protein [Bdellovibrionota bacterium]